MFPSARNHTLQKLTKEVKMSKSAAADVVLHHLFRCCCKIRADCIFFKSQSFVHDSFYVRPAQVSIVDVLAQAFSTAVRGKSPHKTLQNLEQIKTIPILRCKQILLVLYSHAQIECLLERESSFSLPGKRTYESGINIWFSVWAEVENSFIAI